MIRKGLLTGALLLSVSGSLYAQGTGDPLEFERDEGTTRVGTRGANFLEIAVGARAQALAGAYTALAEGPSALYWNTAGSALDEGFAATYSLSNLFEGSDISHNFVAATLPTDLGTIGASVIFLSSGDMLRTTTEYPNGGDPQTGDQFEWNATAVGLHYARRITDRLAVGVAGKFVTEGITGASAEYFGVDLSTIFDTGLYGVTIGAQLANLGSRTGFEGRDLTTRVAPGDDFSDNRRITDVALEGQEVSLPTTFRLGIMTDLYGSSRALVGTSADHNVRFMTDVADAIDTDIQTSVALEYDFREMLYLRGGKRWMNEARAEHRADFGFGLTGGVGLAVPLGAERRFGFDYAYTSMADLENIQTFTVELSF